MNEEIDAPQEALPNDTQRPQQQVDGRSVSWFPKGVSGNPGGRLKGQKNFNTLYKEAIEKIAEMNKLDPDAVELGIVMKGLDKAHQGDYKFYKDTLDRIHGEAIKKTELTGKDGDGIVFKIVNYGNTDTV